MNDPATNAAIESVATAGLVLTVSGSIFGMQADAIMAGFIGALIGQTFVPAASSAPMPMIRRYAVAVAQLVAAGLLAGLLAPVAEAILAGMLPTVPVKALHIATAGFIGMIAPVAVPIIRSIAARWGEKV